MFGPALLGKCSAAVGLSVIALVGAAALQVFICWDHFRELSTPVPTIVRTFSPDDRGSAALVVFQVLSRSSRVSIRHVVGVYDLSAIPPRCQALPLDFVPWRSVCASRGSQAFFVATDGRLYSLDLLFAPDEFQYLGRHKEQYARVVECSDDGSLLLVAGEIITAWDRQSRYMRWQRYDLEISSCCFLRQTRRLFCGLTTGDIFELDSGTGVTERKIASQHDAVLGIEVSPGGELLASVGRFGNCAVIELKTGCSIWSQSSFAPITPRFTPEGKALPVPNSPNRGDIAVLSSTTGKTIAELRASHNAIQGLAITHDGTAYAWDASGIISSWNLATGSVVHRFAAAVDRERPIRVCRSGRIPRQSAPDSELEPAP